VIRAARPDDLPSLLSLLRGEGLPTAEVEQWLPHFLVREEGGRLVAAAGLELHGRDGLLRSVVVVSQHRGRGAAGELTRAAIARARELGLRRLFLLTTTAAAYFPRHGFRTILREEVTGDALDSVEFQGACPASATVMVLDL